MYFSYKPSYVRLVMITVMFNVFGGHFGSHIGFYKHCMQIEHILSIPCV